MRRLLIGDHNQLPAFDTDRIAEFLADQTRVNLALAESDPIIGNIFRGFDWRTSKRLWRMTVH